MLQAWPAALKLIFYKRADLSSSPSPFLSLCAIVSPFFLSINIFNLLAYLCTSWKFTNTLTDLCCKTGCTLSLEAWRARVTGWRRLVWFFSACGVAVIPSDAPDRFSILILSRSFYTIDELVGSARPIRLRHSLTAEQPGLALFLSRAWLHCEGGGKERKTKITFRTDCSLSSSFSTSSSWKPTVHDLLSTEQTHWEYRGQLLVALRDRCFPHKVSETQTDEIWRNAGVHYKQTSFCLKIWRFMTDFKSLTALWPITHFPEHPASSINHIGVSAHYLLHIY